MPHVYRDSPNKNYRILVKYHCFITITIRNIYKLAKLGGKTENYFSRVYSTYVV